MRPPQIAVLCVSFALSSFAQETSSPSKVSKPRATTSAKLDDGSLIADLYRNNYFQFSYQVPFGWVDRTPEMREDTETAKSRVLLAVFERPPAATGQTVNSTVVIAAESATSYPGLKNAADYFGPLSEMVVSKGFKAVNDPYEFPVDGKNIVRRDFTKANAGVTMHQSSLLMWSKGYVLSFTLIGGSDEDVVELIEKLKFGVAKK
jgi:hypothetical protein